MCLQPPVSDNFSTERHNSYEEGGFNQRRGRRLFSSARESSEKGDWSYFVTSFTESPEKTFIKGGQPSIFDASTKFPSVTF